MAVTTYTLEEWRAEGRRLFGEAYDAWRFRCPVCGHVASVGDFRQYATAGATPSSATCECIGRYTGAGEADQKKRPGGPCNYAGYGLFRLSPVRVRHTEPEQETHCFAFAPEAAK